MMVRSFTAAEVRFLTVLVILALYFSCLYLIENDGQSRVKDCLLLFLQEFI